MPHVFASTVIPALPDQIWAFLRDFARVDMWHPDVAASAVEGGGASPLIGQERTITLRDGSIVRERLVALDDANRSYTYSVVASAMPISDHSSTVTLFPVTTNDRTFVTWTADFEVEEGDPAAFADGVREGVILIGFDGMRDRVARSSRD
jgi:Polyketide cyclase / dehydrase and lipid transport